MVLKFERSSFRILVLYAKIFISFFVFITYFTTELRRFSSQLVDSSVCLFLSIYFVFVFQFWNIRMYDRRVRSERRRTTREPNAPAEGSYRSNWKWFEKLTFAISKQRLTLAGQETAALRDSYQRGLLV